ncbi:MAG TPA: autotransporter domain-containing protein, partial [Stellaceae bacterium]|nr:autotransporter domain-containing protein [Stellaceae bacterium]
SVGGLFALSGTAVVSLGAQTLTITNGSGPFSGIIQDGGIAGGTGGSVTIATNAAQNFGRVNTYTGATTIQAGATLTINAPGSIAASSGVTLTGAGATFDLSGAGNQTIKDLTGVTGSVVALGGNTLTLGTASSTSFGGAFQDGGNSGGTGGALVKQGTGALTLSGINTYTGATTINAGILRTNIVGALPTGTALTVNTGGTLQLNGNSQTVGSLAGTGGSVNLEGVTFTAGGNNSSTSYAGTIVDTAGGGSFVKAGTGTLILDGINTYAGLTTINGGTIEIGDATHTSASLAGAVTVGAAGTLMGHGTIGGSVLNTAGGVVAPGGTIGTLNVGGNYTQGAGSSLSIEISPTAASKLNVTGTASLNGTLALVYDPGVYHAITYDIVHAGSVAGTFSTVTGTAPSGVSQSIAYTPTDVDLILGALVVAPTTDTVFGALDTSALLDAQQANATLLGHLADLHSGSGSATIQTSLAATSPTQLAFGGGAQDLNGVLAGLPDAMTRLGGWFRASGNFAKLDGNGGIPGFDTQGGGFMAGIDRPVAAHIVAGIAGGYSRTNLSAQDSESGTIETPRIALYGSYARGPWALDATAGYAYDRIAEARPIAALGQTASAHHDAHEATAATQASYRFERGGMTIMPAAGLDYVHLFDEGFAESGATGFDLNVTHRNADSLRPFIGASVSEPFTTAGGLRLVPEADVSYSHELFAAVPSLVTVGGGSFSVAGLAPSRDALAIGGGLTAKMSDRLALFAAYHATLPTGNLLEQTVSAGLSYRF